MLVTSGINLVNLAPKKTVSFKFELKFIAHLGVLYGYFHICGVSYKQSFQNSSEEELLKRENSVQEKCLNNDNSWIHFMY